MGVDIGTGCLDTDSSVCLQGYSDAQDLTGSASCLEKGALSWPPALMGLPSTAIGGLANSLLPGWAGTQKPDPSTQLGGKTGMPPILPRVRVLNSASPSVLPESLTWACVSIHRMCPSRRAQDFRGFKSAREHRILALIRSSALGVPHMLMILANPLPTGESAKDGLLLLF